MGLQPLSSVSLRTSPAFPPTAWSSSMAAEHYRSILELYFLGYLTFSGMPIGHVPVVSSDAICHACFCESVSRNRW